MLTELWGHDMWKANENGKAGASKVRELVGKSTMINLKANNDAYYEI